MSRTLREALEKGPRRLLGVVAATREQARAARGGVTVTGAELPAIDGTVGARQRARVRVPTMNTTVLVGARVPETRAANDTQRLGYDGITGITDGHVFFASTARTATVQASERTYLVSPTSSLAAVAQQNVLVGAQGTAVMAGKDAVLIVSGRGVPAVASATSGDTPEKPKQPAFTGVVEDLDSAGVIADASASILAAGLVLSGTLQKTELLTIMSYFSKTMKLATACTSLLEETSGRTLIDAGTGVDFWTKKSDEGPQGAIVHGQDGVTITTGTGLGASISMWAPAGGWSAMAGLSVGIVGGISGSMMGLWSGSAYSLAYTTMQSISSATVTVFNKATVDSRLGFVSLRAPVVAAGDIAPVSPQLPTMAVAMTAGLSIDWNAGVPGTTALSLNGLTQSAAVRAVAKITLTCLPYAVEITPLGVKISSLLPALQVAPTGVKLELLPASVSVTPSGVTATGGASGLTVAATGARIYGPLIVLG